MWYGCTALLQWGNDQTVNQIWDSVESEYYDNVNSNGENNSNGRDGANGGDYSNGGRLTPRKGKEKAHSVRAEGAGSLENH
jgi:hypothetical protein